MCRNYELETLRVILKDLFGVEFPEFNGKLFRTTHRVPAVRIRDGRKEAALMRWGLIPRLAASEEEGDGKVNARAETVEVKWSYRIPFVKQRCLLPASAFWEFRKISEREREPHFIRMNDSEPFAFAGIWESWIPDDKPPIETCSMITTEPNELIRRFHDRMPVILPREKWATWLGSTEDVKELKKLLVSYPSELMHEEIAPSPLKTEKPPKAAKQPKKVKPPNKQRRLFE